MSDFLKRVSALSPDRLALLAAELKARLDKAETQLAARNEPIAVVGMGCRFPGGATSPEAYWAQLRDGVDAVTEAPSERWDLERLYDEDPDAPGRMATRWGSFIDGLEDFDPWFFGISPREALGMDPQQRLLLEVAWEALENAGISPDRMDGTPTGVFLGLCNHDFHALRLERPYEDIDSYFASGVAGSMAAGRMSYLLGLQGPALTVDTACSSSLVALHLACESLRSGESRTALAAGVSLMLTPETMIGLSKSRILSGDGRCRTFDAAAGGIARGEGCAVVVLKRLSAARADGDRVLAIIRASGTNQDGRSSGITAPNGAAQESLLRMTLARSGLAPDAIDYVEAHGTGTTLGDPIEVRALGAVYGQRPAERPLQIGSMKTNFGHLEAAAGIAGFMKVVLALQARQIPPHLHLQTKNPHIEWDRLPIEIPTSITDWNAAGPNVPRRGAVSAFGFSGTNAHVILEEAPPVQPPSQPRDRSAHVLPISARSEVVLRTIAERYADLLESPDAPQLADIAHTAATGRSAFPFRLAVVGENSAAAGTALRSWLATGDAPEVRAGRAASASACEPVFVFTGQGSQTVGMGRELFETEPVFRAALERCDAALRDHMSVPLLSVLYPASDAPEDASTLIDRTEYAQPALFALEFALSELWRSWGVEPAAVIGHSLGEYVAATVAGLFTLEDGLRLVAERGRLMQSQPAGGAMASVFTEVARVEAIAARYPDELAIAAINGPGNVVLSGVESVLDRVLEELAADGVSSRKLVVSHAFHSPLMDPILARFEDIVRGVKFGEPGIPIISNLTGEASVPSEMARADYWREHLRRPVRFMAGIRALEAMGHRTFVEVGPHPTLTGLAAACTEQDDVLLVHSLRRGRSDTAEMAAAAGALFVRGLRLDWDAFDRHWVRRTVTLPATPYEKKRFWGGWSKKAHGAAPAPTEAAWTWELDWEPSTVGAASVDPADITARLTPRAADLVIEHGAGDYERGLPLLDAMSTVLIVRGMRALGCALHEGDRLDPRTLQSSLGVTRAHDRLFARMLAILKQDGVLADDGDMLVVRQSPAAQDPRALADELNTVASAMRSETELTLRCGLALADVLKGQADPLELLFPGGSTDEAADLYSSAPSFRVFNTLVRDAVVDLLPARTDRPVRILEVGGGTGGVTRALMPALPRDVSYTFTDVGPLFIARAREHFKAYPGFEGGVLDVSRDPAGQGFTAGSYDLIVASNVLHATPDLRQTLQNIQTLLAPGGAVVVLEGVLPQRFGDMTVGLTDGWWSFTDTDLRPDYALMDPARWMSTFAGLGFEAATALPDVRDTTGVLAQQRVFIARRPAVEQDDGSEHWVAVSGDGAGSAAAIAALEAAGISVTTVKATADGELTTRLAAALDAGPVDGVLHLAALDAPAPGDDGTAALDAVREPAESALATVRELVRRGGPRLAFLTRNAESTTQGETVDPVGSPIWGLARGIALEHPELRCVTLDLPAGDVNGDTIRAVLRTDGHEDQFVLRDSRLSVPRVRHAEPPRAAAPIRFDEAGAYLVTGGLAGLGLRVAKWMAEHGAGTLVLAGRSEPTDAARAEIAAIEALGARVHVVQGDVADRDDVASMIAAAGKVPLRGVMHAAGATSDAALATLDWERTERVMHAKVAGSWNLHMATADLALDHFVLFSSGAAFLGSPGQANHAMANNFLGALAHHRRALGKPALSVDWGPWGEMGAATRGDVLERARAAGLDAIGTDAGLDLLGRLMSGSTTRVAAVPIDWATYLAHVPGGAGRAWFSRVRPIAAATTIEQYQETRQAPAAVAVEVPYLAEQLATVVAGRRTETALEGIRTIAGRVLGAGAGTDIDPATPLTELGLDSLMAVEMRNRMASALGRPLPATLLFNYPSLEMLAAFVVQSLDTAAAVATDAPVAEPAAVPGEDDLDDMSEDEMAELLAEKLKHV